LDQVAVEAAESDPGEAVGRVLSVRGSHASLGLSEPGWSEPDERRATVGSSSEFAAPVVSSSGWSRTQRSRRSRSPANEGFNVTAVVDLMGEIRDAERRRPGSRVA
jgi:hypothetical protein